MCPSSCIPLQKGGLLAAPDCCGRHTEAQRAQQVPPCKQAALKQLPRNKVPNMAVMIKSLTRSTMDASVVFKDPTGKEQALGVSYE